MLNDLFVGRDLLDHFINKHPVPKEWKRKCSIANRVLLGKSRICSRCHIDKPISEYYTRKDRPIGVISFCKQCGREKINKWRRDKPEIARQCHRRAALKHNFGLSIDEHKNLWEKQSGNCALCGTHFTSTKHTYEIGRAHV